MSFVREVWNEESRRGKIISRVVGSCLWCAFGLYIFGVIG